MTPTFTLERTQVVPAPLDLAWAFYCDPRNLEAITPSWLHFRIVEAPAELRRGSLVAYRLRLFGCPMRWLTEIAEWRPPHAFVDVQLAGPYRVWEHTHGLRATGDGTEIYDHVRYDVPGGAPVNAVVRRWLDAIFDFRAERTRALLSPPAEHLAHPA